MVTSAHTRSFELVPSVEMKWPAPCAVLGAEHVVWSLHTRLEVCVLGVETHCVAVQIVRSVQTRSLLAVATTDSNVVLKSQAGVTVVQVSPLSLVEKLTPTVQALH